MLSKKKVEPDSSDTDDSATHLLSDGDNSSLSLPTGEDGPDQDNTTCLFCDINFKDSRGEMWSQCNACLGLAHSDWWC
ncbi:hypothetical protein PR048_018223 [Dryococelus australis]|uniref:Uncharacterized protein n=1 Tax=Dryococelus australis TaxID=614101 RepID=A0ABQ9HBU1_9NEOP|nr:hypothetical protein PR048_018223 [Dryococelus australis]